MPFKKTAQRRNTVFSGFSRSDLASLAGAIGVVIVGLLLVIALAVADHSILSSAAVAPPTPEWYWYAYTIVRFFAIIIAGGFLLTLLLIRLFFSMDVQFRRFVRDTTPVVRRTRTP